MLHLTDAQTIGVFLGGQNFSSCAALLNSTVTSTSTPPMVTASSATNLHGIDIDPYTGNRRSVVLGKSVDLRGNTDSL